MILNASAEKGASSAGGRVSVGLAVELQAFHRRMSSGLGR
jgi:hypothetical protein